MPGTRTPRPARTFTTGPWTRWIRRIALLLIVGTAGWVLLSYSSLPSAVPTHFDLRGEPDAFGDRASALWLVGVMTATGALCGWLSTKPRFVNYPGAVTEQNAQAVYREGERMMVWVLTAFAVVFLGIAFTVVMAGGAGPILVGAGLAGLPVSVIAGLIRLSQAE